MSNKPWWHNLIPPKSELQLWLEGNYPYGFPREWANDEDR